MSEDLFGILLILSDALDDVEATRIANENRLRALLDVKGVGDTKEAEMLDQLVDVLKAQEHQLELKLKRVVRQLPCGDYVRNTTGLGERQVGRLLGATGDLAARPNPAKVWAYCGLHVVDGRRPRRRKGEKANWSSNAKTRALLIAESCVKQSRSPYRDVYDQAREKAATKVHDQQCQNSKRPPNKSNGCGTREHPEWGAPGSQWRPGHQHQYALGIVAKTILKDLWRASR